MPGRSHTSPTRGDRKRPTRSSRRTAAGTIPGSMGRLREVVLLIVVPLRPDGDHGAAVPVKGCRNLGSAAIDFDHFNVSRIDPRQHLDRGLFAEARCPLGFHLQHTVDKHAHPTRPARLLTTSEPYSLGRAIPYPDAWDGLE